MSISDFLKALKYLTDNKLLNVSVESNFQLTVFLCCQDEHPDVPETAVIGIPHEIKGEGKTPTSPQFVLHLTFFIHEPSGILPATRDLLIPSNVCFKAPLFIVKTM